jgi:hypothetical protein
MFFKLELIPKVFNCIIIIIFSKKPCIAEEERQKKINIQAYPSQEQHKLLERKL